MLEAGHGGWEVEGNILTLSPGPIDPHGHPRIFDKLVPDDFLPDNDGTDGKAGLEPYTDAAILAGFTCMIAMTNEELRRFDPEHVERTSTVPYPVFGIDRIHAAQHAIGTESRIPMGFNLTLDPADVFHDSESKNLNLMQIDERFEAAQGEAMGLKIFGNISTGKFNMDPERIPTIAHRWHKYNPGAPLTLHLEDGNVEKVLQLLRDIPGGDEIAINIAHMSSRQELSAVIDAKLDSMNVQGEVTPHHLAFTYAIRELLGGLGCMKPSLKTQDDINFIWDHIGYVDFFGSDCAPHRRSDKAEPNPTFGVTTHSTMIPFLLGAVREGKLEMAELYAKLCVNARNRFGIPLDDNSRTVIDLHDWDERDADLYRQSVNPEYADNNPFLFAQNGPKLYGEVIEVQAGCSKVNVLFGDEMGPSHTHLIRPSTLPASIEYWKQQTAA